MTTANRLLLTAKTQVKSLFSPIPLAFLLSFLLWCFCFKTFLLNQSVLAFDAPPSYNHIKFFIDNIMNGVIPLWDYNEAHGVPNEFFLRRLGDFNPLYLIIVMYRLIGLPHTYAYLFFLATYFFIGMIGFYLLSKEIFKNTITAFLSYLLLMFSTLGSRLFDSHILLSAIPIIWFFYFLIAFANNQKKHYLLGATFSLMIIFTTYIPFYFCLIFLSFSITFFIFYFNSSINFVKNTFSFFNTNKIFSFFCIGAMIISLYPGYSFYKEGKSGSFVMPVRHAESTSNNQISVDVKTTSERSISRELFVSFLFKNLKDIKFKVVYFSLFAFLILFLCLFNKTNKTGVFLFAWGCFLFILASTNLPAHKIFYKYIFFFKFFRNFHFFLWLAILPIFTLFIANQFNSLTNNNLLDKEASWTYPFTILIHFSFIVYLVLTKNTFITSYLTIILSFCFFSTYFSTAEIFKHRFINCNQFKIFALLIIISIQPYSVLTQLNNNETFPPRKYVYDNITSPRTNNFFQTKTSPRLQKLKETDLLSKNSLAYNNLYYGSASYSQFIKHFSNKLFQRYSYYKIYLYDQVSPFNSSSFDKTLIANDINNDNNVAYVENSQTKFESETISRHLNNKVTPVDKNSTNFKITHFDANSLRIKTDFSKNKFLVLTDPYHNKWTASINKEPTDLLKTNIVAKGLWIPPGENIVFLRFGSQKDYLLKYSYFLLFYFSLILLIFLSINNKKNASKQ